MDLSKLVKEWEFTPVKHKTVAAQSVACDQAPKWGKKAKKGVKQQKRNQWAQQVERWTKLPLGSTRLRIFFLFAEPVSRLLKALREGNNNKKIKRRDRCRKLLKVLLFFYLLDDTRLWFFQFHSEYQGTAISIMTKWANQPWTQPSPSRTFKRLLDGLVKVRADRDMLHTFSTVE